MKKRIVIKNVGKAEAIDGGVLFTDKDGVETFHAANTYSVESVTRFVVRRYFENDGKKLYVAFKNAANTYGA